MPDYRMRLLLSAFHLRKYLVADTIKTKLLRKITLKHDIKGAHSPVDPLNQCMFTKSRKVNLWHVCMR